MTVSVSDVAAALETILSALPDVDAHSINDFLPAVTTRKIALLVVPFGQEGVMTSAAVNLGQAIVHAHRIPCEFWIKVAAGQVDTAMQRGRDICLQAMRLLVANRTLGLPNTQIGSAYNGTAGQIGTYNVEPLIDKRGTVDFVLARLMVPVEIYD